MWETIRFWDDEKKFYTFHQKDGAFSVEREGKTIFEGKLLKLKEVEEYPVRPYLTHGTLVLFDYERGIELYRLDSGESKYIPVRAVWKAVFSGSKVYLLKRIKMVILDLETWEILETISTSESFNLYKTGDNLLFYRYRRGKTFLYLPSNDQWIELPKFYKELCILSVLTVKDQLIVFCFTGPSDPRGEWRGIYRYQLTEKRGEFVCDLEKYTANGNNYLDLIDFSYREGLEQTAVPKGGYYGDYLRFLLRNFGCLAMVYYSQDERLKEIADLPEEKELVEIIRSLSKRLIKYPASDAEFASLLQEMKQIEERFSPKNDDGEQEIKN